MNENCLNQNEDVFVQTSISSVYSSWKDVTKFN